MHIPQARWNELRRRIYGLSKPGIKILEVCRKLYTKDYSLETIDRSSKLACHSKNWKSWKIENKRKKEN